MNNLLLTKLPQSVNIEGVEVSINTGFSHSIMFEELFKQNLSEEEFWNKALKIYYPILDKTIMTNEIEDIKLYDFVTKNIDEAIKQMLWFYRCSKDNKEEDEEQKNNKTEMYSFDHDADYIYSAFLDQYGIDLHDCDDLHWWKFKALFRSLKEDNEITRIMAIRAKDTSKSSKEEKEYYRKMKKIYAIPKPKELVEAKNALEEALMSGGDISKLL